MHALAVAFKVADTACVLSIEPKSGISRTVPLRYNSSGQTKFNRDGTLAVISMLTTPPQ